jgi:hypothetical protein
VAQHFQMHVTGHSDAGCFEAYWILVTSSNSSLAALPAPPKLANLGMLRIDFRPLKSIRKVSNVVSRMDYGRALPIHYIHEKRKAGEVFGLFKINLNS